METCRKYGISDATYYSWKSKYAGLELAELKRLKALGEENSKLKRLLPNRPWIFKPLKGFFKKSIKA